MTLVVAAEEADDAQAHRRDRGRADARASQPRHRDPRAGGAGERALEAARLRRSAGCRSASAGRSAASRSKSPPPDAALADLPSVVLPLAVPDLPVILWCRSARLVDLPEFGAIAVMATRP